MKVEEFLSCVGAEFYTGVPDSLLKSLCDYLLDQYGISNKHIIAANEGNCTAIAAGYYMSTRKVPVVYLQNSGIGNIINPVASLLNNKVYGIPCIFIVGWRGEPGVKDEPQHIFQGEITEKLLNIVDIVTYHITSETTCNDLKSQMEVFGGQLSKGKSVAFIVSKNALEYDKNISYKNNNLIMREDVIRAVTDISEEDIVISTTGKASRELFEIREGKGQTHKYDFMTVGSMGHASSIALSIAINNPDKKIWCIDGDGAMIMHMGALAVIGNRKPSNLIHILINNGAHESVGGMPTTAASMNIYGIALSCGYDIATRASSLKELEICLKKAKENNKLTFIEVRTQIGSRKDLGRPTTTPKENIQEFMKNLESDRLNVLRGRHEKTNTIVS